MSIALAVSGLKKSFGGVAAVKGVDFSVAAGEAVALIGPNGAGKTTTFNLINGQIKPDAGRINLHDADITGKAPEQLFRLGVARTFQITATFASVTVRENVLAQRLDETLAIRVILEDRLAPVAAIHDVVNRAGILDSEFASHAGRMAIAALCVNIKN